MAEPLTWERILDNLGSQIFRAQVFGGWLVKERGGGITFVSDPNLDWVVETRPAVVPEPPRVIVPPVPASD
jgi:hypothetical protein